MKDNGDNYNINDVIKSDKNKINKIIILKNNVEKKKKKKLNEILLIVLVLDSFNVESDPVGTILFVLLFKILYTFFISFSFKSYIDND